MMDLSTFQYYKLDFVMFDTQHWELFQLLNMLQESIDELDQEKSDRLRVQFFDGFKRHCLGEEGLMSVTHYPREDFHKQHHKESQELFSNYYRSKEVVLAGADAIAMSALLRDHISVDDRELAEWLKDSHLAERLTAYAE